MEQAAGRPDADVPSGDDDAGARAVARDRGREDAWSDSDVLRLRRSDVAVIDAGGYRGSAAAAPQLPASLRAHYLCRRRALHPPAVPADNHRNFSSGGENADGAGWRPGCERRGRSRLVGAPAQLPRRVALIVLRRVAHLSVMLADGRPLRCCCRRNRTRTRRNS